MVVSMDTLGTLCIYVLQPIKSRRQSRTSLLMHAMGGRMGSALALPNKLDGHHVFGSIKALKMLASCCGKWSAIMTQPIRPPSHVGVQLQADPLRTAVLSTSGGPHVMGQFASEFSVNFAN